MTIRGMSAKRFLRKLNSEKLAKAGAAADGEYAELAKAEIERRKRRRERKSA